MIVYQLGMKPKYSIHLHIVAVSITNMVLETLPTEDNHLVTASGVTAFIKQWFCGLHMLVIKTDLKVLLCSNKFRVNSKEITLIN